MSPIHMVAPATCRRQAGVTLVELMVSMTIGLILIAGLGSIYLAASNVFRSLEASARLQENVRYAFERITTDVRMAGYTGCSYTTVANVLNGNTAWNLNLFGRPLSGYEDTVDTFPADFSGSRARGDSLVLLRADNSREYIIESHNTSSATIKLVGTHDLADGQIAVATDCKHAAIFQVTNANVANSTLVHNTGTASPGNCTKGLGAPVVCSTNGTPYEFLPGSRILRFSGVAFYIRTNASAEPALYRQALGVSGSTSAEEVVDGIEDMQIRYGVDTTPTADGSVDTYTTADDVLAQAPGSTNDEKWARVLAIRISLVAVSTAQQQLSSQIVPYEYNGATVTPTDRRLRKVFTTTISVRNRLGVI
jgi:type IV pilus assembly protein PilW